MVEQTIVWDFLNWQTMVIELIIGGIVAVCFFWRQKKQGDKIESVVDKIQNQQDTISNLISEIKIVEEKQEKFIDYQTEIRGKAEQLAYFMIYASLITIESDLKVLKMIKEKNPEVKDQKEERYIDDIKSSIKDIEIVLSSFGTSIDKEVVWYTMMVIRNSTDQYYHLKQFDEVLGMTKDALKKIERFVPESQRNFQERPY